ncbi:hypothetical protein L3Q82_021731, partial [Scortum barcoo]
MAVLPEERPDVPLELKRREAGDAWPVRQVERQPGGGSTGPSSPPSSWGSVRSLPRIRDGQVSGADPASAGVSVGSAASCCSLRTWLTALTPDTAAELDGGFTLLQADRSKESGKRKGGGLAVLVNDRWCNPGHITVKEQHCCKDIELLAISMRPYYLPREFTHALVVVVYVPPSANADAACDVLLSAVSRLQTQHPDALLLISGDFNHASPSFLPAQIHPPAVTRTVKKWSEEAEEALKDCFNTTLWDVFSDAHGEDIDSLTHCLTDYINFCVENTVPTRTVRSFSNSKPWITPDIKALLKEKRRAFVSGNKEELKSVQRELRRMIRKGKDCYRRKMEHQLQQNNICGVWKGLKTISGFKEPKSQPVGDQGLLLTSHQVRNALKKNRARKAAGPDGISSRLLKSCADQLCGIFGYTFNLSLKLGRVPQLWKTSCIVPVPKTPHPKELNSYRPVALTSHLMKTLERLVLAHLRPLVSSFMDPLQFAYQPDIGVDDAVIYLLHTSLTHLEKAGSTVRIMFFDFSSAFNTIQPRLLWDKLQLAGVDHHLTTWILDYLTHRPQFVRVQGFESDRLLCSTGAPQGTVLAPFLFTLYTADFSYNTPSCHLQKFSDDSAVVGHHHRYGRQRVQRTYSRTLRTGACGTTSRSTLVKPRSWWWISTGVATLRLHRHLLWDSLLGQQHHGQGQEENGQTGHSVTALGSSFSERLLHPRCVKERVILSSRPEQFEKDFTSERAQAPKKLNKMEETSKTVSALRKAEDLLEPLHLYQEKFTCLTQLSKQGEEKNKLVAALEK